MIRFVVVGYNTRAAHRGFIAVYGELPRPRTVGFKLSDLLKANIIKTRSAAAEAGYSEEEMTEVFGPAEPTTTRASAPPASNIDGEWKCPSCEFVNLPHDTYTLHRCELCRAPRAVEWKCPSCEFVNFVDDPLKCYLCQRTRPGLYS